jgi:hypothetical protein
MPLVPRPRPPLDESPTFRFSGHTPEVVLADGETVPSKALAEIARWTSLKLSVALERYPFEWAEDRAPRVPAARALTALLARAAPWTFTHAPTRTSWRGSPARAKRFSRAELEAFTKRVVLQRFNANVPAPRLLVRTGEELDLQYEWSFEVTDLGLALFAHDTPGNRAKLEKLFEAVRRNHQGPVKATLGHGYAGADSTLLAGVRYQWGPYSAFAQHEQKQLAPPWRAHIGRLWIDVPAASAKAAAFASARGKLAELDAHGLHVAGPAPRSATDRPAALVSIAKGFMTLQNAIGKLVSTALHDTKQRKELGAARKKR